MDHVLVKEVESIWGDVGVVYCEVGSGVEIDGVDLVDVEELAVEGVVFLVVDHVPDVGLVFVPFVQDGVGRGELVQLVEDVDDSDAFWYFEGGFVLLCGLVFEVELFEADLFHDWAAVGYLDEAVPLLGLYWWGEIHLQVAH